MNKNLLLALVLIIVGVAGIYWFFFRPAFSPQEAPSASPEPTTVPTKEEELVLSALLTDIKQVAGFGWEATPKQVSWKTGAGELVLMGEGFGYGEDLGSAGVKQKFDDLDAWLKSKGFNADLYNPGSELAGRETRWYRKDNLVCYLGCQDNQAKGSSELEIGCAELE